MKHKSVEDHKFLSLGRKKTELFLKGVVTDRVAIESVIDTTETITLIKKHSNF